MTRSKKRVLIGAALAGLIGGASASARITGIQGTTGGSTGVTQTDAGKKASKSKKEMHTCKGQNTCKGRGGCGATKGRNDCKGKGGCSTDPKHPMPKEK